MSKNKVTVLIIAGVMLLAGIIFCIVSLFSVPRTDGNGGDGSPADKTRPVVSIEDSIPADAAEFQVAEVQRINVEMAEDDLTFFPYVGGTTIRVQIDEAVRDRYDVYAEDGTLNVKRKSGVSLFTEPRDVVLWLPAGFLQSGDIHAETASGDIDVNQIFGGGSLTLNSASGDIEMIDCRFAAITVETASGEIDADRTVCGGMMKLNSTSGNVELTGCELADITAETVSGEVELDQTTVSGTARLNSTSGDHKLTGCDFADITAETTSGSVELRLRGPVTEYGVSAETVSGTVNGMYNMVGGKKVSVSTTSGDITIAFETDASETEQGV